MEGTNLNIALIFAMQICLSLIGATIGTYQQLEKFDHSYLGMTILEKPTFLFLTFVKAGTWILIFTNFVPISLMVTLDFTKLWQAAFIEVDAHMIDKKNEIFPMVQSSNLNEELGQVKYVFSDKTGTLTRNEMTFKKFTAGMKSFDVEGHEHYDKIKKATFMMR